MPKELIPTINSEGEIDEVFVDSAGLYLVQPRATSVGRYEASFRVERFKKHSFAFSLPNGSRARCFVFISEDFKSGARNRDRAIERFTKDYMPWFFTYATRTKGESWMREKP